MDRIAAKVVKAVTGSKIEINEKREEIDMCKALQDMVNEATETGILIGEQRTIQKVRDMVINMYANGIGLGTIAKVAQMSIEEINTILSGVQS